MNWLTGDLPGTGGIYKVQPEDFQVEEIPLYPCSGKGEHLYLWVEKNGITTRELLTQISRGLKIKDREIGYAGLKDAQALTKQMVSIPAACQKQLDRLKLRQARILQADRHGNKLRLGHLAGNRFTIRLRDVHPTAEKRATRILNQLTAKGVPNRFGEQRYGILGNSAALGLLLLQRDYRGFCKQFMGNPEQIRHPEWRAAATAYHNNQLDECLTLLPRKMRDERILIQNLLAGKDHQKAVMSLPRNLLRLHLSACQSDLFDRLLDQRLPDLQTLKQGDIAYKHINGACFKVENTVHEQPRSDNFEISPTAPLFGFKIMLADHQPGEAEQTILAEAGLTPETWRLKDGLAMPGERRPLRVPLQMATARKESETTLVLSFSLPKGSYATSVLREIIK